MVEKKEQKLESLAGKCIVISKDYSGSSNSYYYGGACYGSEFKKAMIFDFDKIPEYIKNDSSEEIIRLDSEKGLKLLIKEVKSLSHYVSIEKPRVKDAEKCLDKLYNFDLIQEWVGLYNKWNNDIIGISHETENKIIEEVISEKVNSN